MAHPRVVWADVETVLKQLRHEGTIWPNMTKELLKKLPMIKIRQAQKYVKRYREDRQNDGRAAQVEMFTPPVQVAPSKTDMDIVSRLSAISAKQDVANTKLVEIMDRISDILKKWDHKEERAAGKVATISSNLPTDAESHVLLAKAIQKYAALVHPKFRGKHPPACGACAQDLQHRVKEELGVAEWVHIDRHGAGVAARFLRSQTKGGDEIWNGLLALLMHGHNCL